MHRRLELAFVIVFLAAGALFAALCVFTTYYGVQLVFLALTYEGEGSLGHVGMYIGALAYPFVALLSGIGAVACFRYVRRHWRPRGMAAEQ